MTYNLQNKLRRNITSPIKLILYFYDSNMIDTDHSIYFIDTH